MLGRTFRRKKYNAEVRAFFMQKTIDIQIGKIILEKLEKDERNVAWLARQIHTDRSNLHRQINNNTIVNIELLYRISKALNIDLFHHYSICLKQKNKTL